MTRKRCPACGLMKEMTNRQVACSRSCGMIIHSRKLTAEFKYARSQKGGRAQGRNQKSKREAAYADLVAKHGLVRACRMIYRNGYAAGFHARHYAECVDARKRK